MRQRVVRVAVVAVAVALFFTVPLAITIRSAFLTPGRGELERAALAATSGAGPQNASGAELGLRSTGTGSDPVRVYDVKPRLRAGQGPGTAALVARSAAKRTVTADKIGSRVVTPAPVLSAHDVGGVVRAQRAARVVWQRVALALLVTATLGASSLLIANFVVRRRARLLREPFEALSAVPRRGANASRHQRTPRAWLLAQLSPDQGSVGPPHPIGVVMGEVEHHWHDQLDFDDRRLVVKLDPEATATKVPAGLVTQVLDVLIDNALRHGRGDVTLRARQSGETLAVDVVDEGSIAMEPAAVFDRGTSGGGGQRASLTLARSMVEARGGRLVVGRRSPATFTLLLPGDTPDIMRPGWLAEQRTSPS